MEGGERGVVPCHQHNPENLSDKPIELIAVELKSCRMRLWQQAGDAARSTSAERPDGR